MTLLNARNLSLEDVQRLLGFQEDYNDSFASLLSLERLTELEQQELLQIRNKFDRLLTTRQVDEGDVSFFVIAPLMHLSGFFRSHSILVNSEENIGEFITEDEGIKLTAKFDIIFVNKFIEIKDKTYFLLLVVESKNCSISPTVGLPQLLTYAYESLQNQKSVWGLVSNGQYYQFVYIQQGNPTIYYLMPLLNLMEPKRAVELLQVLKAICQI